MNIDRALAILTDALNRCRIYNVRTAEVLVALDYLESVTTTKWPFPQFRMALNFDDPEDRWENLNASLKGIKHLFGS